MESEGTDCVTTATVKDFTGLDGCTFLIILDNGDKLLPAKVNDENFVFRDGQRIKFGYKKMENTMSICMAEKMSIEITCIEDLGGGGRPEVPNCFDTDDPNKVTWMKGVIKSNAISSVRKYRFRTDGWAYLFLTKSKQLMFDCQGNKLCTFSGLGPKDCVQQHIDSGDKGKVIWQNQQ